jgi:hypothetical protein
VLGFEFVLRFHRIGRDTENLGAGFGEGGVQAGKRDGFFGINECALQPPIYASTSGG